jgi:hypothetical protein
MVRTNRTITRGKSTTGRWLRERVRAVSHRLKQEVRDPDTSIMRLRLLHPHRIFFTKAMIPATMHTTSTITDTIIFESN